MRKKSNFREAEVGTFFNIQRFSVHDGPGVRTILFAKGCPLRCLWCSNPESQKHEPEIAYKSSACIGTKQCGLCTDACPQKAISPNAQGDVAIDRLLCDDCGQCVDICPAKAIIFWGKAYRVEELVKKVEEDDNYYWRSGGGITIGGGEPLTQPLFVARLLEAIKAKGYHTAVDTCGCFDINAPGMDKALNNTDLLLYDIKLMDPVAHKAYTGQSNTRILANILELPEIYPKLDIWVRTPVIPGLNDTEKEIGQIADFISSIPTLRNFELLSYHAFGSPKYAQLGKCYPLDDLNPISAKKMEKLKIAARKILSSGQMDSIVKG